MTSTPTVGATHALPGSLGSVGQMFMDDRGQALRVTCHAEAEVVVLSIWRADHCVGTVRLGPEEASRLAQFLEQAHPARRTPLP